MNTFKLSQSTIEKLWYYVYLLIDPRDKQVFYIWKGKWNRIYQHTQWISKTNTENDKNSKIIEIRENWFEVQHNILRHWLTEKEALEVESSLIDYVWIQNLTNIVHGHHKDQRGLTTLEQLKINYEAEDLVPQESLLLININTLYTHKMNRDELYEATRKSWIINIERANTYTIVCSVYRWIIREVFDVDHRQICKEYPTRNEFIWCVSNEKTRSIYIHKSVKSYRKKWSQNPIKYIDINECEPITTD